MTPVQGINGLTDGKPVPAWAEDDPRFVSWRSVAAEQWREREREPLWAFAVKYFCSACGLVHRRRNHVPRRTA